MPRIDNSDYAVQLAYELPFDESDPGKTPPVDLCQRCYCSWLDAELKIDHPSYNDDEYRCIECNRLLTEEDD